MPSNSRFAMRGPDSVIVTHTTWVELAEQRSTQAAAAAGGAEGEVLAVVAHVLHIAVEVAGEHGVVALAEHGLDAGPVPPHALAVVPQRLMDEDDGPARVRVIRQDAFQPRELLGLRPRPGHGALRIAHHAEEFGVQGDEEHILVKGSGSTRGRTAPAKPPPSRRCSCRDCPRHGKTGVSKAFHEAGELVPLTV